MARTVCFRRSSKSVQQKRASETTSFMYAPQGRGVTKRPAPRPNLGKFGEAAISAAAQARRLEVTQKAIARAQAIEAKPIDARTTHEQFYLEQLYRHQHLLTKNQGLLCQQAVAAAERSLKALDDPERTARLMPTWDIIRSSASGSPTSRVPISEAENAWTTPQRPSLYAARQTPPAAFPPVWPRPECIKDAGSLHKNAGVHRRSAPPSRANSPVPYSSLDAQESDIEDS